MEFIILESNENLKVQYVICLSSDNKFISN